MFDALTDTTSLLGECPVWCERTERLFWTTSPAASCVLWTPKEAKYSVGPCQSR